MRTWKFCLIVWVLIVALYLVLGAVLETPEPMGGAIGGASMGGLEVLQRIKAAGPQVVLEGLSGEPAPPQRESRAARAAALMDDVQWNRDEEEWLDRYEELTTEHPDLRSILAVDLYAVAWDVVHEAELYPEDFDGDEADTLSRRAVREVEALRGREPENALWSVLLLHHHLAQALPESIDLLAKSESPGQHWTSYSIADTQALRRARVVARDHETWETIDAHWRDRVALVTERLRELGSGPTVADALASNQTPDPLPALMRGISRRLNFLGYDALRADRPDEARTWFEAIRRMGEAVGRPDSPSYHVLTMVLVLNQAHTGLADWWARRGDVLRAGQHHKALYDLQAIFIDLRGQPTEQDLLTEGYFSSFKRLMIATVYMVSILILPCIAAAFWLLTVFWLVWESYRRRRQGAERIHVPWRLADTIWLAVVVVAPLLLFALCIDTLKPEDVGGSIWGLGPTVMFGVPLLVLGLACRRAWQRLRELGHMGRSSPLWLLLALVMVGAAGYVIISGSQIPLHRLGLPGEERAFSLREVFLPPGVAVALFAAIALLVALVRRRFTRGDWALRAARTSFVVRALVLAAFFSLTFHAAAWLVFRDAWTTYWREGARATKRGVAAKLGDDWIDRRLLISTTQPATPETTRPTVSRRRRRPRSRPRG